MSVWIFFALCAVLSVTFGRLTRLYIDSTRESFALLMVGMALFMSGVFLGVAA